MSRTKGAINKRGPDGIKRIKGAGVEMVPENTALLPKKPKAQSGKSSTQGSRPAIRGY